jgi:hypothetical protein
MLSKRHSATFKIEELLHRHFSGVRTMDRGARSVRTPTVCDRLRQRQGVFALKILDPEIRVWLGGLRLPKVDVKK